MHPLRQHFEELISLTDEEFAYIASYFTHYSFKKDDFLLHEDKVVTHEYWVLRGLLKTYLLDANGKEHIVQFAMENWWVTDYQAFFGKRKATLNICCLEDTEILAITYTDKEKLCAELPQFNTFHRPKCNMGYAAQQRRILSLLSDDARTRYEQFAALYPSLLQRLPKSFQASYLSISRETWVVCILLNTQKNDKLYSVIHTLFVSLPPNLKRKSNEKNSNIAYPYH